MPYGPAELGVMAEDQREYGSNAEAEELQRKAQLAESQPPAARPMSPPPAAEQPRGEVNPGPPMDIPTVEQPRTTSGWEGLARGANEVVQPDVIAGVLERLDNVLNAGTTSEDQRAYRRGMFDRFAVQPFVTLWDIFGRTPVGSVALLADQAIDTGLTASVAKKLEAQARAEGVQPTDPQILARGGALATEEVMAALERVRNDPTGDPLERALALSAQATEVIGSMTGALLPGIKVARSAAKGSQGARVSGQAVQDVIAPVERMPLAARAASAAEEVTPLAPKSEPPEELVDQLASLLDEAKGDFLEQRRDVRSHETTKQAARILLEQGYDLSRLVDEAQAGTAVNAERLVAADDIAKAAEQKFVQAVGTGESESIFQNLLDTLLAQKAERGFIAEGARTTEANKIIMETEAAQDAARAAEDMAAETKARVMRAATEEPRPGAVRTPEEREADALVRVARRVSDKKRVLQLAQAVDWANPLEIRAFTNALQDVVEAEAKTAAPPRSIGEKAMDLYGVPKALVSSWDASAPFRQALVATVSHPVTAARAAGAMVKAFRSDDVAKGIMREIKNRPLAALSDRAGLYVAEFDSAAPLSKREEAFQTAMADKIPGIRGSNRAFATYLNKLRADLFDQTVRSWQRSDKMPNEDEYKALAQFLNWTTGRGSLGKLGGAAPLLNGMFFSPRLFTSRIQTVAAPFYFAARGQNRMAAMAAKDIAKTVGLGVAILTLAKMNGAEVGDDPRSSDFGKIHVGNQQVDIWGGYQQTARMMAQVMSGERITQSGNVVILDGHGPFGESRGSVLARFARSKLSPQVGFATSALLNENYLGEDFNLAEEGAAAFIPLGAAQLWQAANDDDENRARGAFIGLLGLTGVGVTTLTRDDDMTADYSATGRVSFGDGPGAVTLHGDQRQRFLESTNRRVNAELDRLITSERFSAADKDGQRAMRDDLIRKARSDARKETAYLAVLEAKTPDEVIDAAMMARTTLSTAQYVTAVESLAKTGQLTSDAIAAIDGARPRDAESGKPKGDTVEQMLRAAPLVRRYAELPPFNRGTPQDWQAYREALDLRREVRTEMQRAANGRSPDDRRLEAEIRKRDPRAADALARFDDARSRNSSREAMLRAAPWLEPYVSSLRNTQGLGE